MYIFHVFNNSSYQSAGNCSAALNISRLHRPVDRTTHRNLGSHGFESSQSVKILFYLCFLSRLECNGLSYLYTVQGLFNSIQQ